MTGQFLGQVLQRIRFRSIKIQVASDEYRKQNAASRRIKKDQPATKYMKHYLFIFKHTFGHASLHKIAFSIPSS